MATTTLGSPTTHCQHTGRVGRTGTSPRRAFARRVFARRRGAGYATAELAVALPSLGLVLMAAVWLVAAASLQARCAEAARLGARAAARGDSTDAVVAVATAGLPRGAKAVVTTSGDTVTVRVEVTFQPGGPTANLLPGVVVQGSATAATEGGPR